MGSYIDDSGGQTTSDLSATQRTDNDENAVELNRPDELPCLCARFIPPRLMATSQCGLQIHPY